MNFEEKIIWIISPEPWAEQLLSKHHYALELARRGNDVVFIEPPGGSAEPRTIEGIENLRIMSWHPFKGLRKLPAIIAKQLQRRELIKIASITKGKPDIIWSFDNSRFFDLNVIKGATSIHHVVDLNQDFEWKRAAATADLCLCTTRFIEERLKEKNERSFNIGHGCNAIPAPEWTNPHPRTRVVYSGNLLIELLDRERVLNAVKRFHYADFHFAGVHEAGDFMKKPSQAALNFVEELKTLPNVTLLGPLQGRAYHECLASADVFMVAYQTDEYEQVANPHKICEFLSTGRVIVSNILDSYWQLELFEMADEEAVWMTLMEQALNDTASFNSLELQAKRRAFCDDRSYKQQVDYIEELLQ
ncbi:hypothetical protein [Sanyastnella coralliicola]|uniref:hypothetical protein n=1 Tax=Sanyastnella coralliicola TaxID=3069118 RepID=UPI0027B92414|nr:hypothetical protein [Longitalea sp. SCSIO 12813]